MTGERPPGDPSVQQVRDRIAQLRQEVQAIADDIRAVIRHSPNAAFTEAGNLITALGEALETGGTVRAQAARGIHQAEALSLAGLATRIGVSKARADQLIRTAKAADKEAPQP